MRPANAYDEVPLVRDKLGGLLEPYTDIAKVREREMGSGGEIDGVSMVRGRMRSE